MTTFGLAAADLAHFRLLIVPGLHGSGPEHWQSRWQCLFPAAERVEQDRWDRPELEVWSARVGSILCRSAQPALLIAHSFGCLATVHHAAARSNRTDNIAGALLVAPADPEKFGVTEYLRDIRLPFPSIVVGSTNDPWMTSGRAKQWARRWNSEFVNSGALGHINAESGLGDWVYGLNLLQRLISFAPKAESGPARKLLLAGQ